MFGNKKDNFKYENEVKALIQEATFGLTQRVIALETQNQQLIQELSQLKSGLYHDFQKLERRITDFTDLWNPFMQQTMNRIKEDLEKTVIDSQREDIEKVHIDLESKMQQNINKLKTIMEDDRENIKKVQADLEKTVIDSQREDIEKVHIDLESKIVKIIEENEKYILIGNHHYLSRSAERINIPIFCLKYDSFNNNLIKLCSENIYLNQIKKLSDIKFVDLKNVVNIKLESGENLNVCIIIEIVNGTFNRKLGGDQPKMIETLLNFTNETGIKLYFNNSEFNQQGVSIKQLLENIITKYK